MYDGRVVCDWLQMGDPLQPGGWGEENPAAPGGGAGVLDDQDMASNWGDPSPSQEPNSWSSARDWSKQAAAAGRKPSQVPQNKHTTSRTRQRAAATRYTLTSFIFSLCLSSDIARIVSSVYYYDCFVCFIVAFSVQGLISHLL